MKEDRATSDRMGGFTLVEILVALLISAVLLSGVISIALSSKQSYQVKENIGRIQENLRFSSEILRRTLSMTESLHQDSNADRIIINYLGGNGVSNCLGNIVASGLVVNHFYVRNNTLYCGTSYPATAGSEQPLVDGIARMIVQYGIDENSSGQAARYTSQADDWNEVISARIILQLFNPSTPQGPEITLTVAMRPRIFARLH